MTSFILNVMHIFIWQLKDTFNALNIFLKIVLTMLKIWLISLWLLSLQWKHFQDNLKIRLERKHIKWCVNMA